MILKILTKTNGSKDTNTNTNTNTHHYFSLVLPDYNGYIIAKNIDIARFQIDLKTNCEGGGGGLSYSSKIKICLVVVQVK